MNCIFDKLWYEDSGMASPKPSKEQQDKMIQAINVKKILLQTLSKEEAFIKGLRYGVNFILAVFDEK